ncbi:MAG TPA: hypothetical protein VHB46_13740 [Burkholderiales bacterium]|nr:hypothetical protein [Burkholderiales bacterium]
MKPKLGRGGESQQNNALAALTRDLVAPPQTGFFFHVEKQIERDGVEMGVLDNGIPYLTESGLARMCGIHRRALNDLSINWAEEKSKPRGAAIADLLEKSGYREPQLYLKSEHNGVPVNAYTEPVCLALLEYYAFVSPDIRPEAQNAFRALARTTFRAYIYDAVGYAPDKAKLDSWQHFHDRIDMTTDAVPFGYFGIFKEIAQMIVPMIRQGVMISDKVVPDISVGMAWSAYWEENNLARLLGKDRIRYEHSYPDYYPQAKSNPQKPFAYPDEALPLFRAWLVRHYITAKFPAYLLGQTKKGAIPMALADKTMQAFGGRLIQDKSKPKSVK